MLKLVFASDPGNVSVFVSNTNQYVNQYVSQMLHDVLLCVRIARLSKMWQTGPSCNICYILHRNEMSIRLGYIISLFIIYVLKFEMHTCRVETCPERLKFEMTHFTLLNTSLHC